MKERPILFSGPMVRAILEARKTQTRRIVKPQFSVFHSIHADASISTNRIFRGAYQRIRCPYGQPGDRLWVRETWKEKKRHQLSYIGLPAIEYAATGESVGPWKPSIFMTRWASRLTLEIVRVRVERLRDISEEDAMAEGVYPMKGIEPSGSEWESCKLGFAELWQFINGPDSWDSNPWVWVIEFKKL